MTAPSKMTSTQRIPPCESPHFGKGMIWQRNAPETSFLCQYIPLPILKSHELPDPIVQVHLPSHHAGLKDTISAPSASLPLCGQPHVPKLSLPEMTSPHRHRIGEPLHFNKGMIGQRNAPETSFPCPSIPWLPPCAPLAHKAQHRRRLQTIAPWLAAFALVLHLHAGPRSSSSYTVPTDSTDAAGAHATSSSYSSDASLGGITGIATATSPAQTAKSGYIGQLYQVTGLQLIAAPTTINESGTRQLAAAQVLDDASTLALTAASIAWSVQSGPLTGISTSGLATADIVGQTTPATVQGSYLGLSTTLGLSVLDTIPDNFGSYASDGLPDSWQNQYFGPNNPLAAPTADATGTGQNNLFKYTAGLNPTDPTSRFITQVGPATSAHTITISPRLPDRTYTIQYSTDLGTTGWQPLTGATIQDNGQTRTITDPDATSTRKFYRVQVSYP